MKKVFLIAILSIFGFSMNAQTEKGSWFFGADAGISFASNKTTPEFNGNEGEDLTISTFSITPSANYFVIDGLAVGLDLSLNSSKEKEEGFGDFTTTSFAIIPNATYFFNEGNVKPYVGAGVGLMSLSFGDDDSGKFSGLIIKGQAGVAYFINEFVALNFGLEYLNSNLSNKEESDFKNKGNTIGVGVGFSFFLN